MTTDTIDATAELEKYRGELTGYCYRMLGSAFEAEDAVQEIMVRAWKAIDRFEGRSSLRTWVYRIASNVCIDMLNGAGKRARPMDLGPSSTADQLPDAPLPENVWMGPIPTDPADEAVASESIRLAFVAALQLLPAKQRAVLVLREVLNWSAAEVAELLDSSVASVNSALQRARSTMSEINERPAEPLNPLDAEQRELLNRYVTAFESYDMDALTSLLHEDAILQMPPLSLWLRTPEQIVAWMLGSGCGCRGSRMIPTVANGLPAFGQYRPTETPGLWKPWALQVLEISDGRITGLNNFLDTPQFLDAPRLFALFGLPPQIEEAV
ncbi:MAG TPA: sigma-70 family RNA polymerase sigma factor [Stackebrandtia sp.]|uniref:sigma-70 family RNA polymerase sigma factor n=1 Tax=Stackebrandtia sp. TaxID=2023065 RepID=UPI002D345EA1|nr:sigma-70 family RNA polymerase sigma factor [Stackebrandtia sp.]HZE37750.1 sigma-70 family RNA polymerase sigma factor [Stackebrandtia sp.]